MIIFSTLKLKRLLKAMLYGQGMHIKARLFLQLSFILVKMATSVTMTYDTASI